jgi:hypothetical protein
VERDLPPFGPEMVNDAVFVADPVEDERTWGHNTEGWGHNEIGEISGIIHDMVCTHKSDTKLIQK